MISFKVLMEGYDMKNIEKMEKNNKKPHNKYVIVDCIRFDEDDDPVLYERMVRKKKR